MVFVYQVLTGRFLKLGAGTKLDKDYRGTEGQKCL